MMAYDDQNFKFIWHSSTLKAKIVSKWKSNSNLLSVQQIFYAVLFISTLKMNRKMQICIYDVVLSKKKETSW